MLIKHVKVEVSFRLELFKVPSFNGFHQCVKEIVQYENKKSCGAILAIFSDFFR